MSYLTKMANPELIIEKYYAIIVVNYDCLSFLKCDIIYLAVIITHNLSCSFFEHLYLPISFE